MSFDSSSSSRFTTTTGGKRVRDESWSATTLGGEPAAAALTASALSFLSASAVGGACSVSSHSRLEVLLRQTELMRRLDADAHEAVRTEMSAQADVLRSHVSALAGAVESAAAERLASADSIVSGAAAASVAAGVASKAAADTLRLRAALAAVEIERDLARGALDAARREAEASAAASRAAVKRAESAAAASGAVAEDLYAQLTGAAVAEKESTARLAEAQRRLALYSTTAAAAAGVASTGTTVTGGDDLSAFFAASSSSSSSAAPPPLLPAGALSAADAASLREEHRAGIRRERAAAETIALLRVERGNSSLLEERIATAEARASRADEAAKAVPALAANVNALLGALRSWDVAIWEPLLQSRVVSGAETGEIEGSGEKAVAMALNRSCERATACARALQVLQAQCAMAAESAARSSARTAQACEKRAEAHARITELELALADASTVAAREADARSLSDAREAALKGLAEGLRATCLSYEAEDRAGAAAAIASDAARAAVAAVHAAAVPSPRGGGGGGGARK
jgi:hypothetical protein